MCYDMNSKTKNVIPVYVRLIHECTNSHLPNYGMKYCVYECCLSTLNGDTSQRLVVHTHQHEMWSMHDTVDQARELTEL